MQTILGWLRQVITAIQHRPRLQMALRVLVTLALVGWIIATVNIQAVVALVSQAHGEWLLLGFLIFLAGMVVAAWRWQMLLRGLGMYEPLPELTRIFFISFFFNIFLPSSIGGDVVRMVLLKPDGGSRADVVSSVLVDRLIGLAVIIAGGLAAALALPGMRANPQVMITLLILTGGFILGIGLLASRPLLVALGRLLPHTVRERIAEPLDRVYRSVFSFRHSPRALWGAVLASVLLQAAICLAVYCAGVAFEIDVGMLVYFALVPVGLAITTLPISINGIGVQDQAMVLLFGAIGVAAPQALALSLYMHLLRIGVGLVGGLFLTTSRWSVRQIRQQEEAIGNQPDARSET